MQPESAVRVALVRLFAIRHGRDVPLRELHRELVHEGLALGALEDILDALQRRRIAVRTARGWRPAAMPPVSRAREPLAAFSWLHA